MKCSISTYYKILDAELYDFICEKGRVISRAVSEHAKRFAD